MTFLIPNHPVLTVRSRRAPTSPAHGHELPSNNRHEALPPVSTAAAASHTFSFKFNQTQRRAKPRKHELFRPQMFTITHIYPSDSETESTAQEFFQKSPKLPEADTKVNCVRSHTYYVL